MISSVTDFGETFKTTFLEKAITLHDVSWKDYKILQSAIEVERPRMKMSLYKRKLTILSAIVPLHEVVKSTLERMISATMIKTQREIKAAGQSTMRSAKFEIAVEPDASYYIRKANLVRLKDFVPDELDFAPDLVVEVDIKHKSDDKFEIYAEFGVSEFWQYNGEKLKIFKLQETGEYKEIERSEELPILTSAVLSEFLKRGQTEQQFTVLSDFQNWLEENK